MQLTEKNFFTFACHHYNNYQIADDKEFWDDIERFKYIKKLITSYKKGGELRDRLILNHLVVLYNVFDNSALEKMLLLKMKNDLDILLPFLNHMNKTFDDVNISEVELDEYVTGELKKNKQVD